jgi:uncharacterized membrane protein YbaN (DUF454 family)
MTLAKILFNIMGTFFVGLGVAGIFLPLVPTTVFLLLASACYLRGSDRLHDWLMNHRVLGAYIRNIRERRGMPMRAKVVTLTMLWTSITFSAVSVARPLVTVLLIATAAGVTAFILKIETLREVE